MKVLRGIMVLALLFSVQVQGYSWLPSWLGGKSVDVSTPAEQLSEKQAEENVASEGRRLNVVLAEQKEKEKTSAEVGHEEIHQDEPAGDIAPVEHKVLLEGKKPAQVGTGKRGRFVTGSGRNIWQQRQPIGLRGTFSQDLRTITTDVGEATRDVESDLALQSEGRAVAQKSGGQLARVQPTSRGDSFNVLLDSIGLTRQGRQSFDNLYSLAKSVGRFDNVRLQIPGARPGESFLVTPEAVGRFLVGSGKINQQLLASFARGKRVAGILPQRSVQGIMDFYKQIAETGRIPVDGMSRVKQIADNVVREFRSTSRSLVVAPEVVDISAAELGKKSGEDIVVVSAPSTHEEREKEDNPVMPGETSTHAGQQIEPSPVVLPTARVRELVDQAVPEWLANIMLPGESGEDIAVVSAPSTHEEREKEDNPVMPGKISMHAGQRIKRSGDVLPTARVQELVDPTVPEWLANIMQGEGEGEEEKVISIVGDLQDKAAKVIADFTQAIHAGTKWVRKSTPELTGKALAVPQDVQRQLGTSTGEAIKTVIKSTQAVAEEAPKVVQGLESELGASTGEAIKMVTELTQGLVEEAPKVVQGLQGDLGAILTSTKISKMMKDRLMQVTFKQKVAILLGLALANAIVAGMVELTDKKDINDALTGLLVIDAVVAAGLFAPEEETGKNAQKSSMPALLQSKKSDVASKSVDSKAIALSGAKRK